MFFYFSVDVKNYCKANPLDILPDPDNCSHYYNCTQVNLSTVTTSTECAYPDLFSPVTQRCEMFTSVKCMKRPEPQAPCKYYYLWYSFTEKRND